MVANLSRNSLLVHELVKAGSQIKWFTTPYERTDRGFREAAPLPGNRPLVVSRR